MSKYYKITFKLSTYDIDQMEGLLKHLQALGIVGASRSIGVVDKIDKDKPSFFFDGDGADKIRGIDIKEISEQDFLRGKK